jgi:hypothetical protein
MAAKKTKQYVLADFRDEVKSLESGATTTPIPLHVLLGEAVDVARFFAKYWKTIEEGDTIVRHGLESVGDRLPASTGAEIMALTELAQDAQSRYRLSVRGPRGTDPVGRATYLATEIDAALAFLFDDGIEDEKDEKLAAIRTAHADTGTSADALAAELADYAKLASVHRTALDGLGGFDVALVDEAKDLVSVLRDHAPIESAEAKEALDERNRLTTLLQRRVGLVRAAARFVFRRDPAIIREVTSAYERRRRRKAPAKAQPPATPTA